MEARIIIGKLCSGKSTQLYQERLKACNDGVSFTQIDIGDIVREITANENRVFDKSLDTQIINRLDIMINQEVNQFNTGLLVIVGIRQVSIYKAVIEMLAKHKVYNTSILELYASHETRKKRFEQRGAQKDLLISFGEANRKDRELGIEDLIVHIRMQIEIPLITIKTD